jgi:hypothetical protein
MVMMHDGEMSTPLAPLKDLGPFVLEAEDAGISFASLENFWSYVQHSLQLKTCGLQFIAFSLISPAQSSQIISTGKAQLRFQHGYLPLQIRQV